MSQTTRIFRIPEECKDFPSDKLLLALENYLFYPVDKPPDLTNYAGKWVQKRFTFCPETKMILDKVKKVYRLKSDREAVSIAILCFLK